jgi:hypothetical protein
VGPRLSDLEELLDFRIIRRSRHLRPPSLRVSKSVRIADRLPHR